MHQMDGLPGIRTGIFGLQCYWTTSWVRSRLLRMIQIGRHVVQFGIFPCVVNWSLCLERRCMITQTDTWLEISISFRTESIDSSVCEAITHLNSLERCVFCPIYQYRGALTLNIPLISPLGIFVLQYTLDTHKQCRSLSYSDLRLQLWCTSLTVRL